MTADRIDAYLDELLPRLHGPAGVIHNTLSEAEAHLRDAADAEVAKGTDPDVAQQKAIDSFGSAREVSAAANRGILGTSAAQVAAALFGAAGRMVAVGLGAVAIAAVAARALAALTSTHLVFGTPAGASFSADQCRHFLAVQPSATSCARAATLEHADDTSLFYLGGAVLGLLVVGLAFLVAHRIRPGGRGCRTALPPAVVPAIGAAVFGTTGIALMAAGLSNAFVSGLWGRGLWYVEGSVSLIIALGYAVGFGRALVTSPT